MSVLFCNLPYTKVYIRKEYLRDLKDGFGEFVEGYWVTAKSIPGRAFYFETYLPEYGAMYDKLPIAAFLSDPKIPAIDFTLPDLQFWNCMDYGVTCIHKQFISTMDIEIFTRNHTHVKGKYLFTLDNYHPAINDVDHNCSEIPSEHKSFNCIQLETGHYALYPNNRIRIYDNSLTPKNVLAPDFLTSNIVYQVERDSVYRLGDTDSFFSKAD
jgi:hypothetical protein